MNNKLDWTHKDVKMTDIRKLGEIYLITIDDDKVHSPLKIGEKIFEKRLQPYFLKDPKTITREEIMEVTWNMYLTQGRYIKIDSNNNIEEHNRQFDKDGWFCSYLEISGPLGSFKSVLKNN